MSDQTRNNKATERRFFEEVWSKGNYAIVNELIAADYFDHDQGVPARGPAGLIQEVSLFRKAFPDLNFAIEDVIAEGDKVVTRITATGTQRGDLFGIPATGIRATISGVYISRYENGKAAEAWVRFDFNGLYRQLGSVPVRV